MAVWDSFFAQNLPMAGPANPGRSCKNCAPRVKDAPAVSAGNILPWLDVPGTLADAPATMNHLKKIKSLIILSAAAVALTGCSGSDQSATGSGTNAATAAPVMPPAGVADTKSAGDAFLAANAKKDGVTTTPSGLQYSVIKSGTGDSPKATDTVTVHYTGTTIDGTVFDSSVQRGTPASFPVNAVIPGWVEALQMMKVGDKWKLVIPANLAYGPQSPSPQIPPNSVLIFEVELLGINK